MINNTMKGFKWFVENKYDLYSHDKYKHSYKFVEKEIDHHLEKAKHHDNYHDARSHMDGVLRKHREHGADDSEPHQHVTDHLNKHYGTNHNRYDHMDFNKGRPNYTGKPGRRTHLKRIK